MHYDIEFIILCDASPFASGSVLAQEIDGMRCPVRFDSRTFSDRERRYAQFKREVITIVHALRKRPYTFGRRFILETDARSVVQMLNAPDILDNTLYRWVAFIKSFDFDVRHVSGRENAGPDALSHRPD